MTAFRSIRAAIPLGLAPLAVLVLHAVPASAQVAGASKRGPDNSHFGHAIANAGDTDGDGIDDVLVGEDNYQAGSLTFAGRVCLYSGATMALIRTADGAQSSGFLGAAVAGAGDVNLDGFADYVVGAPGTDHNGVQGAGMAVVYSGADGSVIWSAYGSVAGQEFGGAVAGLGDVNGDAKSDVLVGSWYSDHVTVYDENANPIYTITETNFCFGNAVAKCGDLDRDGIDDFVVGDPFADSSYRGVTIVDSGLVHAYSAASGAELFAFGGSHTDDRLGFAVAGLGDVDGDQYPDVIAGGRLSNWNGTAAGVVVVASGKDGAELQTIYGANGGDQFGATVAGLGDMNHDGVPDFAVGAPTVKNGGVQRGSVQACSGATFGVLWEWLGSSGPSWRNTWLGTGLAAGDFNGDGIADVVLGDYEYEIYDSRAGTWLTTGGAFEWFGCPAWSENYGSGWAGKNGVPGLIALDAPVPGDLLTIQLDNSLGAATAGLLFLGFTQTNVLTGKGGTILVSPLLTIPLPIGASGLLLTGTLPDDPALDFFDIDLQAIEADAFASEGLSFTAGLRLHCGFDLP